MKNIIKRILREQFDSNYLLKVSRILEKPYFHEMELHYGIEDIKDQDMVLQYMFGDDIKPGLGRSLFDSNGSHIYQEDFEGGWEIWKYDSNNNEIYYESSDGYWYRYEYDNNRNVIYYENSDGHIRERR